MYNLEFSSLINTSLSIVNDKTYYKTAKNTALSATKNKAPLNENTPA